MTEVPGIHHPAWLFAAFLLMLYGFAAILPTIAGLACGWRMRNLSVRRGLSTGIVVGAIAFLLSLATVLVNAASLAIVMLPVSPAVVWLLCWRSARKESVMSGTGGPG